jgi:hypothetical protein
MKREELERVVEDALDLLSQMLPGSVALYFPLLSVALNWAVKRSLEWEEEIFAWQVWPDPEWIRTKSDEFVLDFYKNRTELASQFEVEIENRDLKALRLAFPRLYPIFGLEDPFLCALFYQELEKGDLAGILGEFDSRVDIAKTAVTALPDRPRLLESLKAIVEEAADLGLEALSQKEIHRFIREVFERYYEDEVV